jgi:hypothetical protein
MQNDLGVVPAFMEITARQFLLLARGARVNDIMNLFGSVVAQTISVRPI